MKLPTFCFLLFNLLTLLAAAQEKWDLKRCVNYALENNISVKQADLQSRFSKWQWHQNRLSQLPNANFQSSIGYRFGRSENPTTGVLEDNNFLNIGSNLSGNVSLFNWYSRRHIIEASRLDYEADRAQITKVQNDIVRSLKASVQSARTGLQMANKSLGDTTIVAPMNGIISMLNVKKGEWVVGTAQMAGTEMMRVADMSALEVRVDVGENDIVKVSISDSADVEVDAYNNRKFRSIVTQIASSTTRSGALQAATANDVTNYKVHIRLDPASYADLLDPSKPKKFHFRPGMNASADSKTNRKDSITAVAARAKGINEGTEDKKAINNTCNESETAADVITDELEEVVFIIKGHSIVERRVITTGIQDIIL